MISAIIGFTIAGCCSNVYTFENLIQHNSQITTLITFLQYLSIFVAISCYLSITQFWKKKEKSDYNPWSLRYLIPVISQNIVANLSNYVFQYDIPMSTHIIVKSLGPPITLLLGWLFWRKVYGRSKVYGSTLIAIGSGMFTIYSGSSNNNDNSSSQSANGVSLLIALTIFSSISSIYTAELYQEKSSNVDWKCVLYYNYLIGLLLYIPIFPTLVKEFHNLSAEVDKRLIFWNILTQLACVVGVNILVFRVSALSLNIVLIIRRFISLFLSIYLFEAKVTLEAYIGMALVAIGTTIYAIPAKKNTPKEKVM